METEEVCYTKEAALEKAIEMEAASFKTYKNAYFKAKDRVAKDLLKDLALDELKHKYTLEKAFFEETVQLHDSGSNEGPSMNLTMLLQEKPLDQSATDQDVMVFAIHDEKRAVDFYGNMAEQCGDAPMGGMYSRLREDERNHLARLEELYEKHYMQDM
ncbi:MAG: ferritin family protein [Deltaproteobacteria bacterium]|nr:ferritin family protein [Deltaproteobacteria bacterium]